MALFRCYFGNCDVRADRLELARLGAVIKTKSSIWRDIISGLLGSSTTQVLLNGTPRRIFHRHGLKQGGPLPYAFYLGHGRVGAFVF
jgi:hypothetical protein